MTTNNWRVTFKTHQVQIANFSGEPIDAPSFGKQNVFSKFSDLVIKKKKKNRLFNVPKTYRSINGGLCCLTYSVLLVIFDLVYFKKLLLDWRRNIVGPNSTTTLGRKLAKKFMQKRLTKNKNYINATPGSTR